MVFAETVLVVCRKSDCSSNDQLLEFPKYVVFVVLESGKYPQVYENV